MVSALLASGDSCTGTGTGMVSQWTLTGSTTAYSGTLTTTDGYQIAAAMTWVAITSYTTTFASESVSGAACAIGTCVETLDSAGTRVASTVTDDGNNAICHWFYVLGGATSTAGTASTGTGNWGETKFLTHAQWGTTSGGGVIGSTIKSNGTSVSTSYGHTLSPASVTTFAAGTYSMTWYQPTYASTYSSTALRRYNGGTADADKVKAYCVGLRLLSVTTVLTTTGITAASSTGTVTLTGASALAATAIAFGVAALHL